MRTRFFAVASGLILSVFLAVPAQAGAPGSCESIFSAGVSKVVQQDSSLPRNLLSNPNSRAVQTVFFEDTRFLVLDLGQLPEAAPEYRLAVDYLYRDYPELMRNELNKDNSFINEMNKATTQDWSQIKLFLAVNPEGPATSVTGGLAFIIAKDSTESLPAIEKLKYVTGSANPLPESFFPAAEIGRTGVFGTPREKTRRFTQLIRLAHQVAKVDYGIKEFLVFTKISLLTFYEKEVKVDTLANLSLGDQQSLRIDDPDTPKPPKFHDVVGRFRLVRP